MSSRVVCVRSEGWFLRLSRESPSTKTWIWRIREFRRVRGVDESLGRERERMGAPEYREYELETRNSSNLFGGFIVALIRLIGPAYTHTHTHTWFSLYSDFGTVLARTGSILSLVYRHQRRVL